MTTDNYQYLNMTPHRMEISYVDRFSVGDIHPEFYVASPYNLYDTRIKKNRMESEEENETRAKELKTAEGEISRKIEEEREISKQCEREEWRRI